MRRRRLIPSALITGAGGQLGRELCVTAPDGWSLSAQPVEMLDITDASAVTEALQLARPDVVINAAAYTAVDRAESERDAAARVNARGAEHLANAAGVTGARLIHVSTDFVFDGSTGRPYLPGDGTNPINVYGATKLAGEAAVLAYEASLVLRTAWLYDAGGPNFVLTMLRLMRSAKPLRVVADQVGSPTWARSLARAIWRAAERPNVRGIHHWTDAGVASWYDFAVAIQEEALACGLLATAVPIAPIRSDEYPTPARRPAFSVLEKSQTWSALDLSADHWRTNLRHMLAELPHA